MKRKTLLVVAVAVAIAFSGLGLAYADNPAAEEDDWLIGEIVEINPEEREIFVAGKIATETGRFVLSKKTLAEMNLGDMVRIYYDKVVGLLSIKKMQ